MAVDTMEKTKTEGEKGVLRWVQTGQIKYKTVKGEFQINNK